VFSPHVLDEFDETGDEKRGKVCAFWLKDEKIRVRERMKDVRKY